MALFLFPHFVSWMRVKDQDWLFTIFPTSPCIGNVWHSHHFFRRSISWHGCLFASFFDEQKPIWFLSLLLVGIPRYALLVRYYTNLSLNDVVTTHTIKTMIVANHKLDTIQFTLPFLCRFVWWDMSNQISFVLLSEKLNDLALVLSAWCDS